MRPHGSFLEDYGASNETFLTNSVVFTTEFQAMQAQMVSRFRNHYSETRFAANGDLGTTPKLVSLPASQPALFPNAFRCQRASLRYSEVQFVVIKPRPYCFETHVIVGAARVPGCFPSVELRGVSERRPVPPDQLTSGAYVVLPPGQTALAIDASLACT